VAGTDKGIHDRCAGWQGAVQCNSEKGLQNLQGVPSPLWLPGY
jgi:hypothetical protein